MKILLNKNVKFKSIDFSIETEKVIFDRNKQTAESRSKSIFKSKNTTISSDGFLFIIEKNKGNIIRITNLNYKTKLKKQNFIVPTGFILNSKNLYVSTSRGNFLIVDIISGKTVDVLKIDNSRISRGFVYGKNIYLIRDNSIIRLN